MAKVLRAALALGCSYAILASASAAQAQQADQSTADEIIVTAQFREQRLQDTPLAITAMTAETLEARGQTDLSEVANQAPNVTLKPTGGAFGPSMAASIRGVGQYDFNPAMEPGVGIYVDDVYLPTLTGSMLRLLDLERVEILRGPQGTLTGRNSIGGAIRLISSMPSGEDNGYFEVTTGSRDLLAVRGSADFKLADGVYARISGVGRQQDGYVDIYDYGCLNPGSGVFATRPAGNCKIDEAGDENYNAVRGMLRFEPNQRLDLTLTADYIKEDRGGSPDVLLSASNSGALINATDDIANYPGGAIPYDSRFLCGSYCSYGTGIMPSGGGFPYTYVPERNYFEGRGVSGILNFDFTDTLRLTSITAYREYESAFSGDADYSPAFVATAWNELDHEFFSQELRLNGELSEAFTWTLGAYYSDQTTIYWTQQELRWAGLQFLGDDPVDADSQAVFATGIWDITDALTLTLGARYTEESKSYTFNRTELDGDPHPLLGAVTGVTGIYEGDSTDYRVSIDYRWSPSFMTYATVSTGFKGGGISPRPYIPTQVLPFGPEQLTAYEVGLKSDFFDNRVRFNASVFFNEYEDIQLTLLSCDATWEAFLGVPFSGPCALTTNAGDAEVQGLEAELLLEPIDGLSIDAAASYVDFEYTSVTATGVTTDMVAPFTPETKWSLGIQYRMPFAGGTLTPRVDASYQSEFFTNAVNSVANEVDSYTVVNARLTWRNADEDLTIALEGSNLTDEYYFYNRFDLSDLAGTNSATVAPGSEWALVVRKDF